MAEYNPSKIIKDGNTYNFRDTTKIPLAGSNAISGSLIPATDNSIDIGSSTKNIKALYTKGITIDGKTIDTDANDNMTFNGNIVDTIEEQGTGYIRYTNGIQICYGHISWQTKISNLWGAMYESDRASEAYARSFIETPYVSACNVGYPFAIIESSGGTNTMTPYFYLCRGEPVEAINNAIVDYIAIGRWR